MLRAERQRLENQQVQGALEQVTFRTFAHRRRTSLVDVRQDYFVPLSIVYKSNVQASHLRLALRRAIGPALGSAHDSQGATRRCGGDSSAIRSARLPGDAGTDCRTARGDPE